jgi:WhiB family redox-sensing transcriptional regulator
MVYTSSLVSTIPFPPFAATGLQACKDVDPDLFYPPTYRATSVEPARVVCRSCVFMQECGTWAVRTGEPEGVWGTLTPEERRALRRRLNLA